MRELMEAVGGSYGAPKLYFNPDLMTYIKLARQDRGYRFGNPMVRALIWSDGDLVAWVAEQSFHYPVIQQLGNNCLPLRIIGLPGTHGEVEITETRADTIYANANKKTLYRLVENNPHLRKYFKTFEVTLFETNYLNYTDDMWRNPNDLWRNGDD